MTRLVDEDVRRRAREGLGRSMALAAGAGSGKTSVLVARVVNLLRAGTPPGRVAAITFTTKAAGELIARVRDELEEALLAARGEARERLAGVLEDLPALTLTTIHAFCGQLLRLEALEAGWAPGTAVMGDGYAPSSVAAAYAAWRDDFARRRPEVVIGLRRDAAVAEQTIEKAALKVLENRDLRPRLGRPEPAWDELAARLRRLRGEVRATLGRCSRPGGCALVRGAAPVVDGLEALPAGDEAAVAAGLELPRGSLRGGRVGDWDEGGREAFKAAIEGVRSWQIAARAAALEPLHGALVEDLVAEFLPRVAAAKRAAGQVDYQDLLFNTLALLEGRPAAARRLAERFDAILVDEVQDTDPIQSAVVARLTRAPGATGPWDAHPPRPGALFAVGDVKQSIYRFRRADVEQWRRLQALVRRDGDGGTLAVNFRSVPGIVGFVNAAFKGYPGYEPLVAHREAAELDPVVMLVDEEGDADEAVARYLQALVRSGARVVEGGRARPVRWGDVMVLLPSWTRADALQQRLMGCRIPSVLEGGRTFFGRDEVRLCRAALRALEEPADGEAVVFVLRGLFGVSLAELAAHVEAGGGWRYTMPGRPETAVGEALGVLAGLHRRRGEVPWVRILDELLEVTGARAVWSLLARGPSMLGNVDKLRAVLRELEGVTRSGAEVVARLEELARDGDEDLPLASVDSDVVRVTTYFKAKGLEAPVVVLPHARRKEDGVNAVVDREGGELLLKVKAGVEPPGWAEAEEGEKAALVEERRRWMYVAATRARDQLVIVRPARDGLLEGDLAGALPGVEAADGARVEVAEGVVVAVRRVEALAAPDEERATFPGWDGAIDALLAGPAAEVGAGSEAWRASRRRRAAGAKRRGLAWRTVTEVAAGGGRRWRRGEGTGPGREVGVVVHRVMEHLVLGVPAGARVEEAEGLARAFGAEAELDEAAVARAVAVARRLAVHPVVERAGRAAEVWREVPLSRPTASGVMVGTIDLVFAEDAGRTRWVVADWKSELPAVGSEARGRYEAQVRLYAEAFVAALGAEGEGVTVEAVLVGPHDEASEDPWEEALEEAAPALAEVLEALRAAGCEAPGVGVDVGAPAVASDVELVWPEARVAVAVDHADDEVAAMRAAGWTVLEVSATPTRPLDASALVEAVVGALTLTG